MNRGLAILLAVIVVAVALVIAFRDTSSEAVGNALTIETDTGTHTFTTEIALTADEQAQGLMYRRDMEPDHGMLFIFQNEREAHFWMKNTYLSLDMIFVNGDGTVRRVAKATTPLSLEAVSSNGPVKAVFEVIAGTADRIGLKAGDRIRHETYFN